MASNYQFNTQSRHRQATQFRLTLFVSFTAPNASGCPRSASRRSNTLSRTPSWPEGLAHPVQELIGHVLELLHPRMVRVRRHTEVTSTQRQALSTYRHDYATQRQPKAKAKAKTNVTSRWIVIAHQPHAALGGLTLGSGGTPSFLFVWIPEQVPAWSAFPTSDRAARGQPFNIVLRRLQTKTDSFFQPPLPPSPTNALSEGRASLWCVSGGGPRWCARVVAWTARLTAAFPCPWRSSPWPRR